MLYKGRPYTKVAPSTKLLHFDHLSCFVYVFCVFVKIKSLRLKTTECLFSGMGGGGFDGRQGSFIVHIWDFDGYDNYVLLLAGLTDFNCLNVFKIFGHLVVVGRVFCVSVCRSFRPSILPFSIWKFS